MHVLVIVVLISFTLLGRWQLGVFEDSGKPPVAVDAAPAPLTDLAQVGVTIDAESNRQRVTASGVYDAGRQLLVANRQADVDQVGGNADEGEGFWALTPLRLADGTVIPVVRGWVAEVGDPALAVPEGPVVVTGRLLAPQGTDSVQRRPGGLPDGQVLTVSTAQLINMWPGEKLRNGFVVAQDAPAGLAEVKVAPPQQGGSLTWRNLAYAANWWIFALFALFMWFHFVRDAVRSDRERDQIKSPDMALEG